MQNRFFAMLARMKLIRRWGLMFSTRDENLSEHSLDTAFFMHALLSLHNRRFLTPGEEPLDLGTGVLLAIYHDAAEILTGDLPTPVKYSSALLKDAYKALEREAEQQLAALAPPKIRAPLAEAIGGGGLNERERRILKAADRLSALIKCIEERQSGNLEFASAEAAQREALAGMKLPEADYFIETMLPAYTRPLDELRAEG